MLARAQRAQGRRTVRRLLDAGLAEFAERGFQAVTVDDIARRARTSHGTFYLYFASKEDFFTLLAADALRAMDAVAAEFPVVTANSQGRAALRAWVDSFCQAYASYATVFQTLSQADLVGRDVWQAGLDTLLRMADTIALGMIAGMDNAGARRGTAQQGRLGAMACLMMLERVNYLFSTGVAAPSTRMLDQLAAIIFAAFHTA